jgi:hypothetical protein
MTYHLVNDYKKLWKDPPCYQWVVIHYFYHHFLCRNMLHITRPGVSWKKSQTIEPNYPIIYLMIYPMIIPVLKQPCSRLIPPMVSNPISRRGLTVAGPPALRRSQGATGPSSNQVGTDGGLNGIFDGKDFYMGIQCGLPWTWWFNGDLMGMNGD